MTSSQNKLVQAYRSILESGEKYDNRKLQKLAASFDISDKTEIKESAELAVVQASRAIALNKSLSHYEQFQQILSIYNDQVNMSHRTSQSILLQQYSTPGPIAYLASTFVRSGSPAGYFLEPSAGNGSLTLAMEPHQVHVNEIDELRRSNLQAQGYRKVTSLDASGKDVFGQNVYDGMITNPPFGRTEIRKFGPAKINTLEHLMALEALAAVKDDGRAAIIIGGHTNRNENGHITRKDKPFFAYLYHYYHVVGNYNISGDLYSRMGTKYDIRLILIDGRKSTPSGTFPIGFEDPLIEDYDQLFDTIAPLIENTEMDIYELEAEALALKLRLLELESLGLPYMPTSKAPLVLDVETPDSMAWHIHQAVARVQKAVGPLDTFVQQQLHYPAKQDLFSALSAEQIDAVALGIYNMELKNGLIVGDQTGIGKGRTAAAFIRYAHHKGLMPIFLTVSNNLFTDIHRDLTDIGIPHLRPFIVNGRSSETHVKEGSKIVFKGPTPDEMEKYLNGFATGDKDIIKEFKSTYDYIEATYSQFSSKEETPKQRFLAAAAKGAILIMDEAHMSSGSASATGIFFQEVLKSTQGVIYLSATFAKSADNLPIYALKTSMRDANLSSERLVSAIKGGGVPMQEIISANLVAEGQMIRRERSYKGIEINWIPLKNHAEVHRKKADAITSIVRQIISFQEEYVKPVVQDLSRQLLEEGATADLQKGTKRAGVDNMPYFSKVFNIVNQMLFAIKAEQVAERAIERLREGKKAVIAFGSTFESFLEDMEDLDTKNSATVGSRIKTDFGQVLLRGLHGVMRFTVRDHFNNEEHHTFTAAELGTDAMAVYSDLVRQIKNASTDICLSPIDLIAYRIEQAGYKVGEVTGRGTEVELLKDGTGIIRSRGTREKKYLGKGEKNNTKGDAFRKFQDNELDVLLINQSGATGASAHATPTKKVPKHQVKQRVMISGQAELDISIETQKRGRIFRTGQILPPIYEYLVSEIPAEKRLMMMLQKKLKSLDANTSSNQKNSENVMNEEDFLNHHGDKIVREYLMEHRALSERLGDPLFFNDEEKKRPQVVEAATKASGRVAILPAADQEKFYVDVLAVYNQHIKHLRSIDEYDLEVESLDLEAETIDRQVLVVGKSPTSLFGTNSYIEKVKVKVLKKPFKQAQILEQVTLALAGQTDMQYAEASVQEVKKRTEELVEDIRARESRYFEEKLEKLLKSPKIKKLADAAEKHSAIEESTKELKAERDERINRFAKSLRQVEMQLINYFRFFYPGRVIKYDMEDSKGTVYGVCTGWKINRERSNPFAPSAVEFQISMANGIKHLSIPASQYMLLNAIMGTSSAISAYQMSVVKRDWDTITKESSADFAERYIITGNLLQAFGNYRYKLINYTKADGSTDNGILIPESVDVKQLISDKVILPIYMALPFVKRLSTGQSVQSIDAQVSIINQSNGYKILVPSGGAGRKYYLDEELLQLANKGLFEKASNKMVALVSHEMIGQALKALDKHGVSLEVSQYDFRSIEHTIQEYKPQEIVELPEAPEQEEDLELLELEAEAVALALKLLNLKKVA